MDMNSDSESIFSVDSLEDESDVKEQTNVNSNITKHCLPKCNYVTVPYYSGEILVENVKKVNIASKPRSAVVSTRSLNHLETKSTLISKEKVNKYTGTDNQLTSYFWNSTPSEQQNSKQRVSRRKELITQNKNSLRSRHRSLSYLERFRKKNYGTNYLDSSGYSTEGSKLSGRDKSLSFISCLSGESRMTTSEIEFYDELMMSSGNEQLPWNEEILQSSTLLTEKALKSAKSSKCKNEHKAKPFVLSKIEVMMPDQQKTELDKKRSIEKREIYANKVKLRNQIKFNRQKEREKNDKLHGFSSEDSFHQPQINNIILSISERKTSVLPPSRKDKEIKSTDERKSFTNECNRRSNKRRVPQSYNKKYKKTPELLSSLQERHEREKTLIESMRNLILKT